MFDPSAILAVGCSLLSAAVIHASLEDIYAEFRYPIGALLAPCGNARAARDRLAYALLGLRLFAAVVVFVEFAWSGPDAGIAGPALVGMVGCSAGLMRVMPGGVDTWFQIIFAAQFAAVFYAPSDARPFGLALVAGTVCLAYMVPGIGKFMFWRRGDEVIGMLSYPYIHNPKAVAFFARHPRHARGALVMIKLWETSFPVALAHPLLCAVVLTSGAVFHLVNASLMGFSRVPLTLMASYPAVYWVAQWLHR